jgi:hypothetical protein
LQQNPEREKPDNGENLHGKPPLLRAIVLHGACSGLAIGNRLLQWRQIDKQQYYYIAIKQ